MMYSGGLVVAWLRVIEKCPGELMPPTACVRVDATDDLDCDESLNKLASLIDALDGISFKNDGESVRCVSGL